MKILYFVNSLNNRGGVAHIVTDKMNNLVQMYGCDVTCCVIDGCTTSAYPLSEKIKVLSLVNEKSIKKDSLLGKLKGLVIVPLILWKMLKNERYDVIVNAQTQIVTWVLPFIRRNVPKVMEIHFSHYGMECNIRNRTRLFQWLYWKIAVFVFSMYSRFVVLTDEDKNYWNLCNISVIGNFTNFRETHPSKEKKNRIILTARYRSQKRIDLLIDAWSKIAVRYPDWKVVVYGYGSEKNRLQTKVDSLSLQDSFILNDVVDDVEEKYAESSIFAMTSEYEGFALVLLEAMRASLPICAFDVVGVKGIVDHEKTGLVCHYPDVDAFANNLSRLIENAELRERLGENGQEKLNKEYSKQVTMDKWWSLFCDLAKSNINKFKNKE